ncbi:glycosyltransferase family 2 protein [Candidatus Daviesbacteria bacterium]|nr:glycosyltransferase family 2 protein [Candidatus Daviesbacteria bacterium]
MNKKNKWPSVSVAIATRNSERTLALCLSSVRNQNYPSGLEIIIADGGSVDQTLVIARRFKSRIINVPEYKQNAEYNKGVAVKKCKNEILLMIDHDNILPHKNWLKNMIRPLVEDSTIIGSGVLRFHYDKDMSLVDRYSALYGGTDPVTIFFNKSAHQGYLYQNFHLKGELVEERKYYYKVQLYPNALPALGGNGSILRRSLLKYANTKAQYFFHIDIHVDLAKKGYTTYAFVKDTIIHLTNNNFIPFLRRRRYFIEKYHFVDHTKRRYSIYDSKTDKSALLGYVVYSLSIILPTLDAMRGFIKIRDYAWFLHPLMCLGILLVYGITTIKEGVKNVFLAGNSSVGYRG